MNENYKCKTCGSGLVRIEVHDTKWDYADVYTERCVVRCVRCKAEHKITVVFRETEVIDGWKEDDNQGERHRNRRGGVPSD